MEYLDGGTLKHRIAGKPVEADVLVGLAIEIAVVWFLFQHPLPITLTTDHSVPPGHSGSSP